MWEGNRITPDKLPQEEKDRRQMVIDEWVYEFDNE